MPVRIPHGEVAIYTSPRRLIAIVTDVAARTEALEEVFRGPAAKIAFDEAGNPTKAAIGFARGKGLDVDALERRDENGTEYVYAVRQVPSQDVAALLPEVLRGVIDGSPGRSPAAGAPRPRCSRARCAGWWRFWVTR